MSFDTAIISRPGPRPVNEDAVATWRLGDDGIAIAIADGLGGMGAGDAASNIALAEFGDAVQRDPSLDLGQIARTIHRSILDAQQTSDELSSMATTFSAAVICGSQLRGVHVGDSRIAIVRGMGVKRLTDDHSEGERFYRAGKLTKEQLRKYPRKHILVSALGIRSEPQIDTFDFALEEGDKVIFTTDGVHNKIFLRELFNLAHVSESAPALVGAIEDELLRRGPEDNYSIAAIFLHGNCAN